LTVALALAVTMGWAPAASASTASREIIVGTARITKTPQGWLPSNFYLQICPAGEKFSMQCSGQRSGSPNQTTGLFSMTLPAKAWKVGMYYYTANGQIIPSRGVAVAAQPGETIHHNVSMAYVVPAVEGTVGLTGAPKNFNSLAYMGVQSCPTDVSFSVGCKDGNEAYEDVGPGSHYLIDIPRGRWNVAADYWAENNSKNFTGKPVAFVVTPGVTKSVNVTMAYQGI
jgi:hypothetical protein